MRTHVKRVSILTVVFAILAVLFAQVAVFGGRSAARADDAVSSTTVYFYNGFDWENVYAYAYADSSGELLGTWNDKTEMTAVDDREKWRSVNVPAAPGFTVIFHNGVGKQTESVQIANASDVYVAPKLTPEQTAEYVRNRLDVQAAGGFDAAEQYFASSEKEVKEITRVFFWNSDNWAEIGVYAYNPEVLGKWGSTKAVKAGESSWYYIDVPHVPGFSIIFYNTAVDSQRSELNVPDYRSLYIAKGKAYENPQAIEGATEVPELPNPSDEQTPDKPDIPENPDRVETDPNSPVMRIYFKGTGTTKDWPEVYAYCYQNNAPIGNPWPGDRMQKADGENEGWLYFEITKNIGQIMIIINNNSGNQLGDLSANITVYDFYAVETEGSAFIEETKKAAEDKLDSMGDLPYTRIWFYDTCGWGSNIYAHYWGTSSGIGTGWPGAKMLRDDEQDPASNWYYVDIPSSIGFSVIINKAGGMADRAVFTVNNETTIYFAFNAEGLEQDKAAIDAVTPEGSAPSYDNTDISNLRSHKYTSRQEAIDGEPEPVYVPPIEKEEDVDINNDPVMDGHVPTDDELKPESFTETYVFGQPQNNVALIVVPAVLGGVAIAGCIALVVYTILKKKGKIN